MQRGVTILAAVATALLISVFAAGGPITGGGGLTKVTHGSAMTGSGTSSAPLDLRHDCSSGQTVIWAGSAWGCGSAGGGTTGSGTSGRSTRWTSGTGLGTGAWTDDGTNAAANGTTTVQSLIGTVITPSAITGTVNDYSPTGLATATVIVLSSSSGTVTLTGLQGCTNGRVITLVNADASNTFLIAAENGGSSASNRFVHPWGSGNISLPGGLNSMATFQCLTIGANTRWRMRSLGDYFIAGGGFTDTLNLNSNSLINGGAASFTDMTASGRTIANGTGPTLSSCGTSPSSTTGTTAFTVTVGSGSTTGCTATYATACPTSSTCTVGSQSSTHQDVYISAESASAVTVSNVAGANLAGIKLDFTCVCH